MLSILHGEHHVHSRNTLVELLERARLANKQVVKLEQKQLDEAVLQQVLNAQSLFGEERVIVIEELHSLPKSKKRDQLISLLAKTADDPTLEVILWEKKQLSATDVKAFPKARVQVFAPTKVMFSWLGALSGDQAPQVKTRLVKLLQDTVSTDGEQFSFAMLIRQVRLLMEAKESPTNSSNPRVTSQAKLFSWNQLFSLHKQLLLIDVQQKNSSTPLSLFSQLELLLATL